jgi:hypothetical protein
MPHGIVRFGLFCALLLAIGCGGGSRGTVVKGKVTYNGKPLVGAVVALEPKGKEGPQAAYTGKTNDQGAFEIAPHAGKPIPPGRYQVLISKLVDKKGNTPSAEDYDQLKAQGVLRNMLPGAYSDPASSDLFAEVKEGENVLPPYELKGPAK